MLDGISLEFQITSTHIVLVDQMVLINKGIRSSNHEIFECWYPSKQTGSSMISCICHFAAQNNEPGYVLCLKHLYHIDFGQVVEDEPGTGARFTSKL